MKICPTCSYSNSDSAIHCGNCRSSLDGNEGAEVTRLTDSSEYTVEIGDVIDGRYKVVRLLGHGGMGEVYLTLDLLMDKEECALKLIHHSLMRSPEARQRFRNEVSTSRKLHHLSIIKVHDMGQWKEQEQYYFTMEYLEGKTLATLLKESQRMVPPFALNEIGLVMEPLLQCLSYAHAHTIHRDIKPDNIIIKGTFPDVSIKILDFGIARIARTMTVSRFTQTAQGLGTPYYMAPEQLKNAHRIDHRADLYGVGMILDRHKDAAAMLVHLQEAMAQTEKNLKGIETKEEAREEPEIDQQPEPEPEPAEITTSQPSQEEKNEKQKPAPPPAQKSPLLGFGVIAVLLLIVGIAVFSLRNRGDGGDKVVENLVTTPTVVKPAIDAHLVAQKRKQEQEKITAKEQQASIPKAGDTYIDPTTGMEFVYVEGGSFYMGQTEKEKKQLIAESLQKTYNKYYSDELPRHEVSVDGFWMGRHEVTVGQWRRFIWTTNYRTDAEKNMGGNSGCFSLMDKKWSWFVGRYWNDPGFSQSSVQPVACVSYNDVQEYIKWLNGEPTSDGRYRLPTEAEWEYSARGGTKTIRFWGDDADSRACRYANVANTNHGWSNFFPCDDGYKWSSPVGSFQPNDYGLYDMLGNVWEWCLDWYGSDYYKASPLTNLHGPSSGSSRVIRGGGWNDYPGSVRAANRSWRVPDDRYCNLGFRLVMLEVDAESEEARTGLDRGKQALAADNPSRGEKQFAILKERYDAAIFARLHKFWSLPEYMQKKPELNAVVVITINKDGSIANMFFEKKSSDRMFDQFIINTIESANPLPPIPPAMKKQRYEIGLRFKPGSVR